MKKLYSAILSILASLLLAAPAFADAALPPRYGVASGVLKWIVAFVVAIVIIVIAILVGVVRYKRREREAAAARKPEDK